MEKVKLELFLVGGGSVARVVWGLKVIPSPQWILKLKAFTLDKHMVWGKNSFPRDYSFHTMKQLWETSLSRKFQSPAPAGFNEGVAAPSPQTLENKL